MFCMLSLSTFRMCLLSPQYATKHFSDMNINPAPECTWSLSSKEVKALSHVSGSDFVYALTENEVDRFVILLLSFYSQATPLYAFVPHFCSFPPQVHRLPVEECSNFTDCSTCITEGGLLCGWCSVENKCSRRPQCANSNSSDGPEN